MENDKNLLRQHCTRFVSKVSPEIWKHPNAVTINAVSANPEQHKIYAKVSFL